MPDAAETQLLRQLASRDREVRNHEQAHASAAGDLAHGGPSYTYTRGPDGRQYATGGEVRIDVSPVANDPAATVAKAQKIRRAALAPANPSQQDRAVAARATAMANQARVELQRQALDEGSADGEIDRDNAQGEEAVGGVSHGGSSGQGAYPSLEEDDHHSHGLEIQVSA